MKEAGGRRNLHRRSNRAETADEFGGRHARIDADGSNVVHRDRPRKKFSGVEALAEKSGVFFQLSSVLHDGITSGCWTAATSLLTDSYFDFDRRTSGGSATEGSLAVVPAEEADALSSD